MYLVSLEASGGTSGRGSGCAFKALLGALEPLSLGEEGAIADEVSEEGGDNGHESRNETREHAGEDHEEVLAACSGETNYEANDTHNSQDGIEHIEDVEKLAHGLARDILHPFILTHLFLFKVGGFFTA
jgi:hypothetical protein